MSRNSPDVRGIRGMQKAARTRAEAFEYRSGKLGRIVPDLFTRIKQIEFDNNGSLDLFFVHRTMNTDLLGTFS